MKGTAPFETTNGVEIARAAWKLLNECIRDQAGQGGTLPGIGKTWPVLLRILDLSCWDSHKLPSISGQKATLGIILRSYDPSNIRCGTSPQRYTKYFKCNLLLREVPADVSPPIRFGPSNQSGIDKALPMGWELSRKYSST